MAVGVISADRSADKHYNHTGFSSSIADSYTSPGIDTRGITWDGLNVMSADSTTDKHFKHLGFSDTITDSYASPGGGSTNIPTGITWDGSNVISADSDIDKHYKHAGFSSSIADSYTSPSTWPVGITWDGSNVISADMAADKHYKHSGFSDTITDSYASPDQQPEGIGWDGSNVISADSGGGIKKHFKHSGFSDTITDSYISPDIIPQGIAWAWPTLLPTGIASAEAFGTARLNLTLEPTGIASAEALGTPNVALALGPTGIVSAEAFGTPQLNLTLKPVGIVSAEAFGAHQLNLTLGPTGIASAEAFGTPEVFTWGKDAGTRWGDGALWGDTTLWGDSPGWGSGKKWGTGVLWGQSLLPYPRGNHIRLEIRTASGTDYTAKAIDTAWRIESVLSQRVSRCWFTFRDTSASDIDEHDEVIVLDQSQTRLFAGFVESFEMRPDGVEVECDVTCVDYSWLLDHPTSKITKIYESGTADSDIIADFADYVGEIDFETNVSTIEPSLEREYYENMTPRQILDLLCKRTGGQWYVDYEGAGDYKASLYYYAPGSADAPFSLVDGINLDPSTAFPYGNLRKIRKHGTCTKVIVEGRPTLTEAELEECCAAEADGTKKRFDLPYKLLFLQDEIRPLIWVTDGAGNYDWQKVGYGGTQDSLGDPDDGLYDVLYYSGDKYLEFYTAPPTYSGAAFLYTATEVHPTEGEAEDATGEAKYGRHLEIRVIDDTVHDSATADLVAAELLARWKGEQDTYTCVCWEHGLRAGQVIELVNADLGINDDFIIQRVSSRGMGGDLWEHELELGQYNPDIVDVVQDLVVHKSGKEELGLKESNKPPIIGQIMFGVPGTLSLDDDDPAPWYICAVNGLQILSTQLVVKTAPVGADIEVEAFRQFNDPDSPYYGLGWYSVYNYGEWPYIPDGERIGVDGTLASVGGIPWLREGDFIKIVLHQVGSTTAGADLTFSLKVRQ